MTDNNDLLQQRLHDLADELGPLPVPHEEIRHRTRRLRRWRRAGSLAAAAAVAVTVVTVSVALAARPTPMPVTAPDGPFLGWPVTGNATGTGLLAEAVQVWDSTRASGPHTDIHALLVDRDPVLLGPVVVLEGRDAQGEPRLAILTGTAEDRDALRLRADRPAPDPVTTRVVSMVSGRLSTATGIEPLDSRPSAWLFALGAPGVTGFGYHSTAVDQELVEGGGPDLGRRLLVSLPPGATPINTTVIARHAGAVVFRGPADGGAIGDAVAVPATVLTRSSDHARIQGSPRALLPGRLVATPDGLLGRITAASGEEADVELVTAASFSIDALTDITYRPLRVVGTGGNARLDQVPADANVVATNRIVTVDPAQHSDRLGTLTIGRVGTTGHDLVPATATSDLSRVYVMVEYEAASR
ncbi:rod shape-determining protein MreC [Dactylosporangium salmoneum]|uniref:Rod shape-determining protein MreC beta-barrel core domain-containing protein n=1 Tax=Dactylosporangium salmoneum TaxID=53361 RepID=A0ABN3FJJ4_9ACTN